MENFMNKIKYFFLIILLLISQNVWSGNITVPLSNTKLHINVRSWQEIQRENVVIQSTRYTCGAAALATIINYYLGGNTSEAQIIELTGEFNLTEDEKKALDKNSNMTIEDRKNILKNFLKAISLLGLKRASEKLGYKAVGYKEMELEHLAKFNKPVIVFMKVNDNPHFSVFKGTKNNNVFLADPSLGNIKMSNGRFLQLWQRIGMVVTSQNETSINENLLELPKVDNDRSKKLLLFSNSLDLLNEKILKSINY